MIKKKLLFAITIAIGGLLMSACSNNNSNNETVFSDEDNTIILNIMKTNYGWNLPSETPDIMINSEAFFKKLLNSQDTNSWIKETSELSTSSTTYDIGFEYAANKYNDGKTYYVILYVKKGSKAEQIGIERGYIITHVSPTGLESDQIAVSDKEGDAGYWETLLPNCIKSGKQFAIRYRIPNGGEAASTFNPADVIVSTANDQDPVYYSNSNIYSASGKKIGYMVINHFSHPDKYLSPLISKLNDFKSAGVKTLILDLRYSSTGGFDYLKSLGSSLVKTSERGAAFAYVARENSSNDIAYNFSDDNTIQNLGDQLDNIYVITGNYTAGPAETLIHALRAYWGDKLIVTGEDSQGKNIAMSSIASIKREDGTAKWAIYIQLGYFADKNKNYDYRTKVNNEYKEVNEKSGTSELLKPLGDTEEYVLNETLKVITGLTTVSAQMRSSQVSNWPVPVKHLGSSIQSEPGTISLDNLRY